MFVKRISADDTSKVRVYENNPSKLGKSKLLKTGLKLSVLSNFYIQCLVESRFVFQITSLLIK